MNLIKKSRLLNEVVFIGSLLYIFILITQSLRLTGISFFLPNKTTIFEILKTYFIAISLLMVVEYFIAYDLPNNYLISRLFGIFVMSTFTLVAFNIFNKSWVLDNTLTIQIIYISSIIYGGVASYYVQGIKLNRSLTIGLANYVVIALAFVVISVISPVGYIFE